MKMFYLEKTANDGRTFLMSFTMETNQIKRGSVYVTHRVAADPHSDDEPVVRPGEEWTRTVSIAKAREYWRLAKSQGSRGTGRTTG